MAGESKTVSFKAVVDTASFQQVHRVLDDLIKKAKEFAQVLQGGGGLLGGGMVGGKLPGPQSTMVRGGTYGSQSQSVSFTKLIGQNAQAFKSMAQEGGNAAKSMGDQLLKTVVEQQLKIRSLRQDVLNLAAAYEKASQNAAGAGGPPAAKPSRPAGGGGIFNRMNNWLVEKTGPGGFGSLRQMGDRKSVV
jgi:hypothetical protein